MARVGVKKKVFELLSKSSSPLDHAAIASKTGIDLALMIIRYS